jgi:hypothetical protein
LLVVIAIIALLLAIIIPALNTAKQMAGSVICTSNEKQVLMAWIMYSEDNDSLLVSPYNSSYDLSNTSGRYDWVEGSSGKVTVEDEIYGMSPGGASGDQGIVGGAMYPYYEEPELLHCPSDKRYVKPATGNANKEGAYRTYSLIHHTGDTGGRGPNVPANEKCLRLSDISNPGSKFVLVEENDCRGLSVGSWIMARNATQPGLIDSFGIYHNMRSILGFADGHAEKIVWKDDRTEEFSQDWFDGTLQAKQGYHTTSAQEVGNEDFAWLYSHYATKN